MMAVDQIARMMAMDAAQQGGGGGDSYTKAETDELLDGKADKATTYTKTEIDAMIGDINSVLEEVL